MVVPNTIFAVYGYGSTRHNCYGSSWNPKYCVRSKDRIVALGEIVTLSTFTEFMLALEVDDLDFPSQRALKRMVQARGGHYKSLFSCVPFTS